MASQRLDSGVFDFTQCTEAVQEHRLRLWFLLLLFTPSGCADLETLVSVSSAMLHLPHHPELPVVGLLPRPRQGNRAWCKWDFSCCCFPSFFKIVLNSHNINFYDFNHFNSVLWIKYIYIVMQPSLLSISSFHCPTLKLGTH